MGFEDTFSVVTRNRIQTLYPGLRAPAFRVLQDIKIMTKKSMHVTDALRSMEEQLAAYAKGRTQVEGKWVVTDRAQIVTNAQPGLSWHSYGLALDCAWDGMDPYLEDIRKQDKKSFDLLWKLYADCLRAHGFKPGADFRLLNGVQDLPHGQMTFGLEIHQAKELLDQGGLVAVWAFIDKIRGVSPGQDWNLGPT